MNKAESVSSFKAGAILALAIASFCWAAPPAAIRANTPMSSFRGAGSFGVTPRLGPSMPMNNGFAGRGFGTTGRMFAPSNQWNVKPDYVPGTLPVLNSNTLPVLNSNTLPVLNSNTSPMLNSNTLPVLNPNTLPILNRGNQGFPSAVPGVPGVQPGSVPTPPGATQLPNNPNQPCPTPPVVCPPGWNWWPWGWNGWVVWNGWNYAVYWNGYPIPPYVPGPFGGLTYLYDPNLLPGATQRAIAEQAMAAPAPAPSAYDYGVAAFRDGQSDAAVKYLAEAVRKDKEDTGAMRVLALALLDTRQPDDAAAMMRRAYSLDPTLSNRDLDINALGLNAARRSSLINRSVEYANRIGSASSWLMVTVLMQADGRYELARRMLKRAADAGLEPDIANAMDAALGLHIRQPRQGGGGAMGNPAPIK
ncbi:MAG: tetratricopeptide repeat protein [Phycisphaeraceae bacterium]|nr:tetratricopeptide repeat protein [Phycisphaeraceae bacterium]